MTKCLNIQFYTDLEHASEFMESTEDTEKRFLYTGKEQRREAKDNFEEKCERKTLGIHRTSKPRWCPELPSWDLWMDSVKNDKVVYPPLKNGGVLNPATPKTPTIVVQPQVPIQPPFGRPNPNPYPPNMNNLPFGRPNPNPQYPNNMNQYPNGMSKQMFDMMYPNQNQFPNQYRPNIG